MIPDFPKSVVRRIIREAHGKLELGRLSNKLCAEGFTTKGIRKYLLKYKDDFHCKKNGDYGAFLVSNRKGNRRSNWEEEREDTIDMISLYFDDGRRSNLEVICEICVNLGYGMPNSVRKGKDTLAGVYINIFDYVDGNYRLFPSRRALAKYSKKEKKIFPRKRAKGENLRFLLKKFFY